MANLLILLGYHTKLCVVRGTVSLPGQGDEAGEIQLWHSENNNKYCIYAGKTAGYVKLVCELLMFLILFHFQECTDPCTDKIKTLVIKRSKFHFVQHLSLKQMVPCESTDKRVSSRGSRVRTKFYGSITESSLGVKGVF